MLYKQIKVFLNNFLFRKMTLKSFKTSSMINEDIEILSQLGKGAYGAVYKMKAKDTEGAVKVLGIANGFPNPIELHIMSTYRHPNLMALDRAILRPRKKIGLVMPLAQHDLASVLNKLSVKAKQKVITDVTNGLDFLHDQKIIHLDIKEDNVLILGSLDNPVAQLHDFGLAMMNMSEEPIESPMLRITYNYRPPEIKDGERIMCQKGNDIWSLGMLFMTIVNGEYPFKREVTIRRGRDTLVIPETEFLRVLYERLSSAKRMTIIRRYSNVFYAPIIDKMLNMDVNARPTTKDIIEYLCQGTLPSFYANGSVIKACFSSIQIKPFHNSHMSAVQAKITTKYNPDISVLFLFYDLAYRSIPCLKIKTNPKGQNKTVMAFFAACAWIALKFYTNDIIEARVFAPEMDIVMTKLIEMEISILQHIKGIIHRPYLYDICRSVGDLVKCYNLCMDGTKYLQLNIDNVKSNLKPGSGYHPPKMDAKTFMKDHAK